MIAYRVRHPQAKAALWLAHYLDGAPSDVITRALALSEVPRRLFVLAATLRKAQGSDGTFGKLGRHSRLYPGPNRGQQ